VILPNAKIFSRNLQKPLDNHSAWWYNDANEHREWWLKTKTRRKTMDTNQYLTFINDAISTEGYKTADIANKMALEIEAISLDQYRAAAQLIVDAYKKENW
jgi:hypothetical protein